jgi:amidohydrolase
MNPSPAINLAALGARISAQSEIFTSELVALRRDLHAHPELGRRETRTTGLVAQRLSEAGLSPRVLPGGSGLICDIGEGGPVVALRADIDALPIDDEKEGCAYRSTIKGVAHACGHDMHTAILVGVGLVLAELARDGEVSGRVRLVFQPAEESMPGGALDVIDAGGLEGVRRIFALHCDPRQDVGTVGIRVGPITGSSDHVKVLLSSIGGHTARPHLTGDLVYALAKIVSDVPAVLSRRVDPRAGLSVVWGQVHAGGAANVIPQHGEADGTVRTLDSRAWEDAEAVVTNAVESIAEAYGVHVKVDYTRGVPPVINEVESVAIVETVARAFLGDECVQTVEQSLGGEDFAWYLDTVPGALFRLGVHNPADAVVRDLHQGTFDADEDAIGVGVRLLVGAALCELSLSGS